MNATHQSEALTGVTREWRDGDVDIATVGRLPRQDFEESLEATLFTSGPGYFHPPSPDSRGAEDAHQIGVLFYEQGKYRNASEYFRAAVKINPANPIYHSNLGNALQEIGEVEEAITHYHHAIELNEGFSDAYFNLGNALSKKKLFNEAVDIYSRVITINPSSAATFVHRGIALLELKRASAALADFETALSIDKSCVVAHINRGIALRDMGLLLQALRSHEQAIALDSKSAEAYFNHGQVLQDLNCVDEAIVSFDQALRIRPNYPKAISCKGMAYLRVGLFDEGWPLYEWRWHPSLTNNKVTRRFGKPWRGQEDLKGKRILLYAEQGLGDTIQFSRYAKEVQNLGARVVLQVQKPLIPLLSSLNGYDELTHDQSPPSAGDYHCPLMSLPLALRTKVETIPRTKSYLSADPARVERWKRHLGDRGFKIAVAWQGNHLNPLDIGRSYAAYWLYEISRLPNVRLISIQKGAGSQQLGELPVDHRIEVLPKYFDEHDAFLDSAAVMKCVDLVITSDSALTHLAGALGVRTWLPLKYSPEWRWMLEGDRTPWYPTVRLFRQPRPGDWQSVFEKIRSELSSWV